MNNTKSQETVKHTALPWAFKKVPVWAPTQPNGNIPVFEFSFAGGDEWMRTAKANTALIVKAINCHDDLLEACKVALDLVRVARDHFPKSMHDADKFKLENTCATIGKAIEKASAQ